MLTKRTPYVSSMLSKVLSAARKGFLSPFHTALADRSRLCRDKNFLLSICCCAVMALLPSCKAQQQAVVSVPRNDSTSITCNDSAAIRHNFERLRQYIRDSVIIREKGDTIRIDHWHIQIKDSIVLVKDTIYKDKERIVYKDKEVLVQLPPERYIPSWAWYSLGASILFFILFLLRIFIRIYFRR